MIPPLTMDDINSGMAGVRAQYVGLDGDTREDFKIEYLDNSIHVLNALSPAMSASVNIKVTPLLFATEYPPLKDS